MTRFASLRFPVLLIEVMALGSAFGTSGWAQSNSSGTSQGIAQTRVGSATNTDVAGGKVDPVNRVAGKRQTKDDAPSNIRPMNRVTSRVENRVRNRLETRIGGPNDAGATTTSAFEDADYRRRRTRPKSARR